MSNRLSSARLALRNPGVIAGGMYVMLGPTVGAVFTLLLAEGLRLSVVGGPDDGRTIFSTGADIGDLAKQGVLDGRQRALNGQQMLFALERLGKPVLAAVNGFALGGGCELAMACHVRVAAEGARLGTPEVKLGLMCGYGGTQRLPRLVGRGRALELLLTGEMIDAAEAHRIGLVNRVVPADKLMEEAKSIAMRMARLPAIAVKQNKEAINRAYDMRGFLATIEYGQEMFCMTAMAHSPEGQEFRKIAREQGLKAAIRWREQRFK